MGLKEERAEWTGFIQKVGRDISSLKCDHALLLLNLRAATFDLAMIGIYGRRSPS